MALQLRYPLEGVCLVEVDDMVRPRGHKPATHMARELSRVSSAGWAQQGGLSRVGSAGWAMNESNTMASNNNITKSKSKSKTKSNHNSKIN